MITVTFQSAFHLEKHVNNVFFLFFLNYFLDQHIKIIWKHQKHINSKKKFNFFKSTFKPQCPALSHDYKMKAKAIVTQLRN